MSRNLSVLDALVSSHTTSGLPYKPRSNLNVEEAFLQAASSVAGIFFLLEGVYDAHDARLLIDYHM